MSRTIYLPHVDGLRAIAVLAVLIYHVNPAWMPGGFAGVDIFFVISGFIVSASVGGLERTPLWKFIPYFYARRLQRIAPALIACLLATTIASTVFIPPAWLSNAHQQTGLYAFFGLSNFILARTSNDYFSPTAEFNPFTHTWSLGVEEQFYFIFPFLFFAWTFRESRRLTVSLFVIALLASFAYSASIAKSDATTAFYMITSRFWQLAAGVLLYQCMTLSGRRFDAAAQPQPQWAVGVGYVSLALMVFGLVFARPETFPFPGSIPVVLGSLGLLGLLHGVGRENLLVRGLTSRPTLFVGRISYSLYLWHWPVIVLFRWTVGDTGLLHRLSIFGLSFALAIASYYLIERPVRTAQLLKRLPRLAIVAVGLVVVFLSARVANAIAWRHQTLSLSPVARYVDDWYPEGFDPKPIATGCSVRTVETGNVHEYRREGCLQRVYGPDVIAIGDSHAMAYNGLFREYVMLTGANVMVIRNSGCPFLGLSHESDDCREKSRVATLDVLRRLRTGDVLFLPSLRLPRYSDQWVRYSDEAVLAAMFSPEAMEARAEAQRIALEVLRPIHEKGVHIVFEAPKPIFRSPTFRCAVSYNISNPICADGSAMSREELEQLRKPVLDAFKAVAVALPDVSVWDPFPILCPEQTCSAYRDGRPLFFDGDHVSGYGNRLLAPSFSEFVVRVAATKESVSISP
ncbi:MAG: acyltransferase family protein [Pseudomonadota bacterium]